MRRGSSGRLLASARRHVEQIVTHTMVSIGVLEKVMVNHHHFVVVLFRHRKSFAITVDLMGPEIPECAVGIDLGDGAEERLL